MTLPVLPYAYKLVHRETGQFYFGYRFKNKVRAELDLGIKYFTSSKIVKPKFYEFNFQVLAEFFDAADAYAFEQHLIEENFKNPLILNAHYHKNGGNHFLQKAPHSEESKKKIGLASKNRPRTKEWQDKQRTSHLGKTHSQETKDKMSLARKGKIKTPEHLAKISKALKGSGNMNKAILIRAETQKKKCTVDGITIYSSLKELTAVHGYGKNGARSPNFKYIR